MQQSYKISNQSTFQAPPDSGHSPLPLANSVPDNLTNLYVLMYQPVPHCCIRPGPPQWEPKQALPEPGRAQPEFCAASVRVSCRWLYRGVSGTVLASIRRQGKRRDRPGEADLTNH